MKDCTQDEFYEFIDNYPRPLESDVCGIGEPPRLSYNDFTLGKWPDSIVASCSVFSDDPYYTNVIKGYKPARRGGALQAYWKIATEQQST